MNRNLIKGFTLLELVIVMAILAILAALISTNFITSLKKGRDAQRKADLEQLQRSLETYYEDKKMYPPTLGFNSKLCETSNCAAGERIYMQKVPQDPMQATNGAQYIYCVDDPTTPTMYQLYTELENSNDRAVMNPKPLGHCTSAVFSCYNNACNYGVSSSNTSP